MYLHRIKDIVDKKVQLDNSPEQYMHFLNRSRNAAKGLKENQEKDRICLENKYLLDKIVREKSRKFEKVSKSYHLAMHEKREKEMKRINQENARIAKRITEQYSTLRKTLVNQPPPHKSRYCDGANSRFQGMDYSSTRSRKLPKLFKMSPQNHEVQN